MDNRKQILWITQTAVFIALLIVMQAVTAPLGNTLITGSIVNLMLIVSVMSCGLASGATVALVSPVMAKFFGIGPLWSLIPFIAAGNMALVLLWHWLGNRDRERKLVSYGIALVAAAVGKFLVLYVGIVKVAIPFFLGLPAPQATVISGMFSFPQLFTAAIGGALAMVILPPLKKAINRE